jgi:transcription elongation factor Elf1
MAKKNKQQHYRIIKCPRCQEENWVINNYEYVNGRIYADCYCEKCESRFQIRATVDSVTE